MSCTHSVVPNCRMSACRATEDVHHDSAASDQCDHDLPRLFIFCATTKHRSIRCQYVIKIPVKRSNLCCSLAVHTLYNAGNNLNASNLRAVVVTLSTNRPSGSLQYCANVAREADLTSHTPVNPSCPLNALMRFMHREILCLSGQTIYYKAEIWSSRKHGYACARMPPRFYVLS